MRIQHLHPSNLLRFTLCFSVFLLSFSFQTKAATITSAQSGDWSSVSTWVGGVVPGVSDDVVITDEHNVTVTDVRFASSLLIENTSDIVASVLSVNTGGVLTITGDMNLTSNVDAAAVRADVTGTLTIDGNIVFTSLIASDARVRMLNGGALTLNGNITNIANGNITSGAGAVSTFTFAGSLAQTIPTGAGYSYHNLVIQKSGSNAATINAAITGTKVREDLIIREGTFSNGGFSITGNSGKSFSVENGGVYIVTTTAALPSTFTHNLEAGSTVIFDGAVTLNNPNSGYYHHLTLQSTGKKTLGANLTVYGNLTISDDTLDVSASDFSISIRGDWVNTGGVFSARNSTVTFNGNLPQSITTGSDAFYNVVFDNLTEGAGAIILNDDLTVDNAITMTNGIISTGSNMLVLTNTTAANLSGFSSGSYVHGFLRRYIASNTSTYSFPVGSSTKYCRADLRNNNLTGVSYITASFGALARHDDADMNVADPDVTYSSLSPTGMWTIDADDVVLSGSYDIYLFTGDMGGIIDNEFAPLKRPTGSPSAASWSTAGGIINDQYQEGRLAADGYALRRGLNSFSEFGLGLKNPADPLPILLSSISARYITNDNVIVEWTTALEINNHYFTIEKSDNGLLFQTLSTVAGAGNSTTAINYNTIDNNPFSGITYYRLKQTDFDGTFTYSNIVSVSAPIRGADNTVSVFPHPVERGRVVNITNSSGAIDRIEIFEAASGKLAMMENIASPSTQISVQHHLAPGIYVARVFSGNETSHLKILVQ